MTAVALHSAVPPLSGALAIGIKGHVVPTDRANDRALPCVVASRHRQRDVLIYFQIRHIRERATGGGGIGNRRAILFPPGRRRC